MVKISQLKDCEFHHKLALRLMPFCITHLNTLYDMIANTLTDPKTTSIEKD
jgi:hypothetical protein